MAPTPSTAFANANTRQTLHYLNLVQPDLYLPQCLHAHYVVAAHAGRKGPVAAPAFACCQPAGDPLRHHAADGPGQLLGSTVPRGLQRSLVERQKCMQHVVHTLIHACRVRSQIEAHLIVDGTARAACEQLVRQAGMADLIHFHGRVPPESVQLLLQRSLAILLICGFEGLPVALLEAMAAGVVPVVRAIESGIPELVLHQRIGLLVENDPVEAAAALLRLSHTPTFWQQCSTQARELVQAGYGAGKSFERWGSACV